MEGLIGIEVSLQHHRHAAFQVKPELEDIAGKPLRIKKRVTVMGLDCLEQAILRWEG